ncbi:CYTH and CHAD domain-containing protein [Rhodococcus sp. NPDC049939]|uniref:CYTH and CHAD domain-containing protein n=1 Tax=Rhodococcus sp. NPDC049939 TaxID=3155511 RepID=UPI0033E3ABBC
MSTPTPEALTEVERKYESGSDQQIPSLSGLPGVYREPLIDSIQLSALYYDTIDLRLLESGITLRRREGGDDAGWHLKLPAGTDSRTELQLPPDAAESGVEVPAAFTDLLIAITRGATVNPVALISTDRERHRLLDSSGTTLAEVVSDVVIAAVPDGTSGPDERVWREIEVEKGKCDQNLLDAIDSRLVESGMTRSGSPSKLRRALGDAVALPSRRASAKATTKKPRPRRLLSEYLDTQVQALIRADVEVRRGTDDSVHALRVAARRIRSVLRVYGSHLSSREATENLIDELRWLGRSLADLRDAEVQWDRLVTAVDEIDEMPDREIVRARLDEYFSGLVASTRLEALATLSSDRYLALLSSLDAFGVGIESGKGAPSAAEVKSTLRKLTRSVEHRVKRARQSEARVDRDVLIHLARKRSKRMRYAIEATQQLSPGRSEHALDTFKEFQDVLGDYQDAVMSRQHLLRMAAENRHSSQSSPGFGFGMLFHRELTIGDSLAAELKPYWKRAKTAAGKILK